jgi:hypothetical protein
LFDDVVSRYGQVDTVLACCGGSPHRVTSAVKSVKSKPILKNGCFITECLRTGKKSWP